MALLIFFLIGLGTGLSGAMIPGPLFLFTCSQAVKKDASVGLRIALGHVLIETVFVALILIGFQGYLTSDVFMRTISIVGGIALLIMGIMLLKGASQMSLAVQGDVQYDYRSIIGGAFFSIISPGFLIWWSTIGFSIIMKAFVYGLMGLGMVALGHWLADFGWHWFVSYFVHKGKSTLKDATFQNMIRGLAVCLVLTGVYFLINPI